MSGFLKFSGFKRLFYKVNNLFFVGHDGENNNIRMSVQDLSKAIADDIKTTIDVTGELIDPVPPGTQGAPANIPNGPAGQKRKFTPQPGFYRSAGVTFPEVTNNKSWQFYWNGSVWQLYDLGLLPTVPMTEFISTIDAKSLAQDEHPIDFMEYNVTNWNAALIERNSPTNVFGRQTNAYKITTPTSGNLNEAELRFTGAGGSQIPGFFNGARLNINAIIWVPEDCTPSYVLAQSPVGANQIQVVAGSQLKAGINRIVLTVLADSNRNQSVVFRTNLGGGKVFYIKNNPVSYVGYPMANTDTFPNLVKTQAGKDLSTNDYTNADKEKLTLTNVYTSQDKAKVDGLKTKEIYRNIASQFGYVGIQGAQNTPVNNPDGSLRAVRVGTQAAGIKGINFRLNTDIAWKKGHSYFVAVDVNVVQNSLTEGSGSSAGNNRFNVSGKDNDSSRTVAVGSQLSSTTTGTRSVVTAQLNATDVNNYINDNSRWLYLEFGNFSEGQTYTIDVFKIFVVDLTDSELTFNQMSDYLSNNGIGLDTLSVYSMDVDRANFADRARVAESVENLSIGRDIEIWGDSLVAQQWGVNLAQITGRNVATKGFGGKRSSYIRKEFLAAFNPNKTQIICLGRNNFGETDLIVDDIRAMIAALNHRNYLILMPPNGGYGEFNPPTGEMKGGSTYTGFIRLQEALHKEYQASFMNSRESTINAYDMGNVRLNSAFNKPAVGATVQISVTDADFLTTYNPEDLARYGEAFMAQIRIGLYNKYDLYRIVSKQSSTLLTVQLVQSNYDNVPVGGSVSNPIDDGGNLAIKYLRVMQEADYQCFLADTTQSTFRSDSIHMSERGKATLAKVVARKLETMKI